MVIKEVAAIIFLLSATLGQIQIIFPISDTIAWTPVVPSEIDCEYETRTKSLKSYFELPGYLPVLHQTYLAEGFLCNSVTLMTKCDTGFFGSQTIHHIEEHHGISEEECVLGVKKFLDNKDKIVTYPAPPCSWMSSSVDKISFIRIRPRAMVYDPYTNRIVSELFVGGECKGPYCKTIYEYEGWLADHHKHPECISDHLDTSLFYIKPYSSEMADLWSPDINIPSGHKICTFDYCGMEGLKFHDGSWIGLKRNAIPKGKEKLNQFFVNLPECPKGDHLSQMERHHTEHLATRTELEEFLHSECLKTKLLIIEGSPLSRVHLQALTPTTPGRHRVYRFVNGSIEMGISDYKEVTVIPPLSGNPAVVRTSTNKTLRWKYWTHDERHNIYDGPNGLFIYNNTVLTYTSDMKDYQTALSLSMKQIMSIDHPTLYHNESSIRLNNGTYTYLKVNGSNFDTVIGHGLQSIGYSIMKYLFIILVICLLTMIVTCAIIHIPQYLTKKRNCKNPGVFYRPT